MAIPIVLSHVSVKTGRTVMDGNVHQPEGEGGDDHDLSLPLHVEIPHNEGGEGDQGEIDEDVNGADDVPENDLDGG